jgi:hypothetical protein
MAGDGGAAEEAVRAFAFAEPEAGRWGAGWLAPGAPAVGVLALGDQAAAKPLELQGMGAEEPWRLTDGDTELALEGLGEPGWSDPEAPQEGFDQLCRVTGTVASGQSRQLDCLGWRGSRRSAIDPAVNSFRLVAGWLDEQDGFVVLAGRPRKSKGQEEDLIAGSLFDPAGTRPVVEPRLSTTYTASGQPARAGVELWIEADADPDHLYPRRAVGQALATPVGWKVAEMAVEAQPFRWFTGGREGPGVYLLGQW